MAGATASKSAHGSGMPAGVILGTEDTLVFTGSGEQVKEGQLYSSNSNPFGSKEMSYEKTTMHDTGVFGQSPNSSPHQSDEIKKY